MPYKLPYRLSTDPIPSKYASPHTAALLVKIERFLDQHNMAGSTFGMIACSNPQIVRRLQEGGDVHTATMAKLEMFMREGGNSPQKR